MVRTLITCLALVGAVAGLPGCATAPLYPQVEPGARTELTLESNIPDTEFSIDSMVVAKGSRAVVLIDGHKAYRVEAKPPGYNKKQEVMQPPYRQPNRMAFYFMIGDKTFRDEQPARRPGGAIAAPLKDVVSYDEKTATGHMVVEGGIEGRQRALKVIGQLCSTKNIGLVAGREDLSGGTYKVTNESLKDGLYRLDFSCMF